jgi:hypothetical protein
MCGFYFLGAIAVAPTVLLASLIPRLKPGASQISSILFKSSDELKSSDEETVTLCLPEIRPATG